MKSHHKLHIAFRTYKEQLYVLVSFLSAKSIPMYQNSTLAFKKKVLQVHCTGKSFSEALILALTNPQYDKRLWIN